MGRHRSINPKLPNNWSLERGTYYFRPQRGLPRIRLGRTLSEAYQTFGSLLERQQRPMTTLAGWIDRYRKEVIPTKAPRTQRDNVKEIINLDRAFGHMAPEEVVPQHIYAYRDARGAGTRFNRERALLSHIFTKIIEWGGFPGPNPCRDVKRLPESPKDTYVEDADLIAFMENTTPILTRFTALKYKTGLRKGDILRLRSSNIVGGEIRLTIRKTSRKRSTEGLESATSGRVVSIVIDDELSIILQCIGSHSNDYLFVNRSGRPYTESGFDSLWQRSMVKLSKSHGITRFSDHDIRAKTATDDPENAQDRLQHANPNTTRIYIRNRKKVLVTPLPEGRTVW